MDIYMILELLEKKYPESHNPRLVIFTDGSGEIASGFGESDLESNFEFEKAKELLDHLQDWTPEEILRREG
jgi:hypothetical protein